MPWQLPGQALLSTQAKSSGCLLACSPQEPFCRRKAVLEMRESIPVVVLTCLRVQSIDVVVDYPRNLLGVHSRCTF